jgi:hypothetical protein
MKNYRKDTRIGSSGGRHESELQGVVALSEARPFFGQLFDGKQAYSWLVDAMLRVDQPISLCSAFLRSEALLALFPIGATVKCGRILVRWQLADLQAGASDLQAYLVAKQLGFKFFVRLDFHGKVFELPGIGALVGSANATLAGLGLRDGANAEVCTLVPASDSNHSLIDGLFRGAVEVNDTLFDELNQVLQGSPETYKECNEWPSDLLPRLGANISTQLILISECLKAIPVNDRDQYFMVVNANDLELLRLNEALIERTKLCRAFKELKIHQWLLRQLKLSGGIMYFGAAAEELHNALLNDPVSSRRDVKQLLQVLVTWFKYFPECGVEIDRPGFSQRLRLVVEVGTKI